MKKNRCTFTENVENIKRLYYVENKTLEEIGKKYGWKLGITYVMFKKAGLKTKRELQQEYLCNNTIPIVEKYNSGATIEQLCIEYKCDEALLKKVLHSQGILTNIERCRKLKESLNAIKQKFFNNERLDNIAKQFKCSPFVIRKLLIKEKIYFKRTRGCALTQEVENKKREKLRLSQVLKPRHGYKPGSGRGKHGYYRGIWCDSSWELAYVLYNLDHGIQFERNHDRFLYEWNNEKHYYTPDFKLMDTSTYVEIKGYWTIQFEAKVNQFKGSLLILDQEKMKMYLDYVKQKYGKDFIGLYEEM